VSLDKDQRVEGPRIDFDRRAAASLDVSSFQISFEYSFNYSLNLNYFQIQTPHN
jgi:hypothetical protein